MLQLFLIFLLFSNFIFSAELTTVDKILAEVNTAEGRFLVTKSDLRPGIDGAPRELKDVVLQKLILADGRKLKLVKEEDDPEYEAEVDKHLLNLKKQNNLSDEDIANIFKESGFSYQEGRNELRNMKIIDSVLDHRIRGKVYVDKKELEDYYALHPKTSPPTYKLSQLFIKNGQIKDIEKSIESGEISKRSDWETPFELSESDIAEDKAFLKELPVGSVSILEKTDSEIKLIKIVDKLPAKVLPLADCMDDIRSALYGEKFQEAMKKYYDSLWETAQVRYLE